MTKSEKMKIATSFLEYVHRHGYDPVVGKKNPYSQKMIADEFNVRPTYIGYILGNIHENILKVPAATFESIKVTLDLKTEEESVPTGPVMKVKHPDPPDLKDYSRNPESSPIKPVMPEIPDFSDMEVNKLPPALQSDMNVSNRLLKVDGKTHEVIDYLKAYKAYYKAKFSGLNEIREHTEEAMLEQDPWISEYEVNLVHMISILDTAIDKLEKI